MKHPIKRGSRVIAPALGGSAGAAGILYTQQQPAQLGLMPTAEHCCRSVHEPGVGQGGHKHRGAAAAGALRRQGAEQPTAQLDVAPQQPALESTPYKPLQDTLSLVGLLKSSACYGFGV